MTEIASCAPRPRNARVTVSAAIASSVARVSSIGRAPAQPVISNARYGTTLKMRTKTLKTPRKAYITRSHVSRDAENQGRCNRKVRSGASRNHPVQNSRRPTLDQRAPLEELGERLDIHSLLSPNSQPSTKLGDKPAVARADLDHHVTAIHRHQQPSRRRPPRSAGHPRSRRRSPRTESEPSPWHEVE